MRLPALRLEDGELGLELREELYEHGEQCLALLRRHGSVGR